jgi:hypothetical protein
VVASLQDLKFEMLPANIQEALRGFGISSTGAMHAMYEKYKDSPTMLNMGMQAIGLSPAAVDQIVAQASAKQHSAAAPPQPPTRTSAAAPKATPAVVAPARAPVSAAPQANPQPRGVVPQAAPRQQVQAPDTADVPVDDEGQPQQPQATPDGEEDSDTQTDPSVNTAAAPEVEAPAQQPDDEASETPDTVEPPGDIDSQGADDTTDVDASGAASAVSDQDAAIEQLIANGRDPSVSGDDQAGARTMASRAMPRGAGKSATRGGPKQQAVMDDIVSQMMAQNAMQQGPPQGMPPAGPQAPQMPPQAQRPPPPVAQRSQRSEEMISNLVKGAKSKQEAQSKRGAPTGRR